MPGYTIVNLLEIDDDVQGKIPGVEGRFSRKYLDSRDLGVSHWRYAPDTRNHGGHSHREQEEAYVVVAGSGRSAPRRRAARCPPVGRHPREPGGRCAPSKPGPTAWS